MTQVRVYQTSLHSPAAGAATNKRVRLYRATLNGERDIKVRVYRAYLSGPAPAGHVRVYMASLKIDGLSSAPVYVIKNGQWVVAKVSASAGTTWKVLT